MRNARIWAAVAVVGLALGACGSDEGGDPSSAAVTDAVDNAELDDAELDDFAGAIDEATGAGGGGILTFDGSEHPIDSAVCVNDGGRIDVGTFFNNHDDRLIVAEFTIECPEAIL